MSSELDLKIENFRKEAEDLIKAVVLQYYFDNSEVSNPYAPYDDVQDALDNIGTNWRPYMTVNVNGTEMWFLPNGDLVDKISSVAIEAGSVSLDKLANVNSGTVFYRKTAGSGPPEVQTLATLAADLGITNIGAILDTFVIKETGKSLVLDALIALIHAPESDNQDLSGYVEKQEGYRLISEDEVAGITRSTYTITLPDSYSVSGRCAATVEGEDYPTGWLVDAQWNPIDLRIVHNLGKRIASVTVFYSIDGTEERQLFGNAAYSGITAPNMNMLVIEALSTIQTRIIIHLTFA
jgi:hypothetical protein